MKIVMRDKDISMSFMRGCVDPRLLRSWDVEEYGPTGRSQVYRNKNSSASSTYATMEAAARVNTRSRTRSCAHTHLEDDAPEHDVTTLCPRVR
jgi:hypothetical protein